MKFNNLEDLVNYITKNIMKDDNGAYLKIIFGDDEIIMEVFEMEIPIKISKQLVYFENDEKPKNTVIAEVYAELLRENIGQGWLKELDDICSLIDINGHIFEKLLK